MKNLLTMAVAVIASGLMVACTLTDRMEYDFQPEVLTDSGVRFSFCSYAADRFINTATVPAEIADTTLQPVIYKSSFMISDTDYAANITFCADSIHADHFVMLVNGAVVQNMKQTQTCGIDLNGYIMQGQNDIILTLAKPNLVAAVTNARILKNLEVHADLVWDFLPQLPSITAQWYMPNPPERRWPGFSFFHDMLGNPTPVVTAPVWNKDPLETSVSIDSSKRNDRLLSRTTWQVGAAWYRFDFIENSTPREMTFRAVIGGDGGVWFNGHRLEMTTVNHITTVKLPAERFVQGQNCLIFCLATCGSTPNMTAAEIIYTSRK